MRKQRSTDRRGVIARAAWFLFGGLLLAGAACHRPEQASEIADDQGRSSAPPAGGQASAPAADPARKKTPDPVDLDAEQVLAAMPTAWREMLAKAEDFHRRERVGWCTTCHVNIRDQLRDGGHDKASISCVDCHGASERHARNENNEIKPDQVFARKDVDRVCGDCHECERAASATDAAPSNFVCTECHPAHKFPNLAAPPAKH